jgi:hypothetical protein
MHENLFEQVVRILSDQTGITVDRITMSSRLGTDLRLDGDDVHDVLSQLESNYVLSSNDFPFDEYFNPENDLWGIQRLFGRRKDSRDVKHLTVAQIVSSVEAKRWVLP